MEVEPWPFGEPDTDERRLVGPVVVHDDVHVELGAHALLDAVEELAELDGPVAAVSVGDYGAGLDVERRKQRRGAVSPIVVRSPAVADATEGAPDATDGHATIVESMSWWR